MSHVLLLKYSTVLDCFSKLFKNLCSFYSLFGKYQETSMKIYQRNALTHHNIQMLYRSKTLRKKSKLLYLDSAIKSNVKTRHLEKVGIPYT